MKHRNSKNKFDQKGAALFTSIFSILLLTILGISLMSVSESSRTVSSNNIEATEAFYIAEAGLAHAREVLGAANSQARPERGRMR